MADPRALNPCRLCGHGVATEKYMYARRAFGAWPPVRVTIPLCPTCAMGMRSGRFAGRPEHAEKIRKRLQRLTGRPWEWSALMPHGSFSVVEGPIGAAEDPQETMCPPGVFCYGAPFPGR